MSLLSKAVFSLFFLAVFLFEGLGINEGREISYFLVLTMPFFLYLAAFISKKRIVIPKTISLFFTLFFIFSTVSTIFSVNIQKSFEYLLYYLCLYLMFVFSYNFQKDLRKDLIVLMIFLSFVFLIYSMLINYGFQFLAPGRGYQYVYAFFGTHNPLGSFLLVILIISLFLLMVKRSLFYLLIFIIFLPFFIFSFSRSSYLSFITTSIILIFYIGKKKKILFSHLLLIGLIGLLCLIFFFVATSLKKMPPVFNYVDKFVPKNLNLAKKTSLGSRDRYFKQAAASIMEKPLFGVGPFNFFYASIKHSGVPIILAETGHNLLLEVFAENGILAGLVFLGLLFLVLKSFSKHKREDIFSQAYFFCFLAMLILFQVDYSQRYYSYFLFFWIVAGLFYKENENIKTALPFVTSLVVFVAANLLLLSSLLTKWGKVELAVKIYPLNTIALKQVTENKIIAGDIKEAKNYLETYGKILSGDSFALDYLGEAYLKYYGDEKQAFLNYKRAYENCYPLEDEFFIKYYRLKKELEGEKAARDFADEFLDQLNQQPRNLIKAYILDWAWEMCRDIYKKCPYKL